MKIFRGEQIRFIGKRLALGVPVLFLIVIASFFLLKLAPGDAADVLAGEAGAASPEYMAQVRQKFMLDKPILVQLGAYVGNVAKLDLGYSFRHDATVSSLIGGRVMPTVLLMVSSGVSSFSVQ